MCMGLSRDHNLMRRLFGCTRWIFGRRFLSFFLAEVSQKFSPNFLMARNH
jgi:hypothetical protein